MAQVGQGGGGGRGGGRGYFRGRLGGCGADRGQPGRQEGEGNRLAEEAPRRAFPVEGRRGRPYVLPTGQVARFWDLTPSQRKDKNRDASRRQKLKLGQNDSNRHEFAKRAMHERLAAKGTPGFVSTFDRDCEDWTGEGLPYGYNFVGWFNELPAYGPLPEGGGANNQPVPDEAEPGPIVVDGSNEQDQGQNLEVDEPGPSGVRSLPLELFPIPKKELGTVEDLFTPKPGSIRLQPKDEPSDVEVVDLDSD